MNMASVGIRVLLLTDPSQSLRFRAFGFLDYISNRHSDLLYGSRMLVEYPAVFMHLDQHVVGQVLGTAISKTPGADPYVRHIRWLLYALEHRWRLICFAGNSLLHHCAASENETATQMIKMMRQTPGESCIWWAPKFGIAQAWFVSSGCTFTEEHGWLVFGCVQAATPDGVVLVGFAGCTVHVPSRALANFDALAMSIRLFIGCFMSAYLCRWPSSIRQRP